MESLRSQFGFTKSQRIGIGFLLGIIFSTEFFIQFTPIIIPQKNDGLAISQEIIALQTRIDATEQSPSYQNNNTYSNKNLNNNFSQIKIPYFNPNKYTTEDWERLGFSTKQAITIVKYKQICGGSFKSIDQLRKCFVISPEKFLTLKPFITLLPINNTQQVYPKKELINHTKSSIHYSVFNPNNYTAADWENVGFSQKQAQGIMKYKYFLGGSFHTKEELQKCYMINANKYAELAPYLNIVVTEITKSITPVKEFSKQHPDEIKKEFTQAKPSIVYKIFNPNIYTSNDWQAIGFTEKQALTILKYKYSLGGSFHTKEELQKCYIINTDKYKALEPFIVL